MAPSVRGVGILVLVLASACSGVKTAPPGVMAPLTADPSLLGKNQDGPLAAEPLRPEAKEEASVTPVAPAAASRQPVMSSDAAIGNEPVTDALSPPIGSQSVAKSAPPQFKAPAKDSTAPVAIEQPRKIEAPPPNARMPEPPMNVAALKERLRDTRAIGVFTKLALKNQVDDLLDQFRAHYLNGQKGSVASLRQAYDMLLLKVLALIQDSDPSLARTISGSREAIWGILANPEKFKLMT